MGTKMKFLPLACVLVFAALAGCGGDAGGSGAEPAIDPPALPLVSSSCLPTQGAFSALNIGSNFSQAYPVMGCEGILVSDSVTSGFPQKIYAWGKESSGPYAKLIFSAGVLSTKLAQYLAGPEEASACLPTAATFGVLKVGASYTNTVFAMGCEGKLVTEIASADVQQKTFEWGNAVSGAYAQVLFKNGALESKTSQRL
jgi:hypothetical protein